MQLSPNDFRNDQIENAASRLLQNSLFGYADNLGISRHELRQRGIFPSVILQAFEERGIHIFMIIRQYAIEHYLEHHPDADEDELFYFLRELSYNGNNPLEPFVREMLDHLLIEGDQA